MPEWLDTARDAGAGEAGRRTGSRRRRSSRRRSPADRRHPRRRGAPPAPAPRSRSPCSRSLNMSADPDNEYFSDGHRRGDHQRADARCQALRVASRTSAFAFKGKNEDIREIGEQAQASRTVLEGSVRKAGNRLRITAQLINVADGYHLWSERYDRELEDVFAIQDEIAGNIVKALRVVLSEDEKRAIEKAPTENVQAYEFYLRGRQFFHQWSRTSISSRGACSSARSSSIPTSRSRTPASPTAARSCTCTGTAAANLEGADAASRRALEVDPELAQAHASRGFALSLSASTRRRAKNWSGRCARPETLRGTLSFRARLSAGRSPRRGGASLRRRRARARRRTIRRCCSHGAPLRGLRRLDEAMATLTT